MIEIGFKALPILINAIIHCASECYKKILFPFMLLKFKLLT